MTKIKVQKSSLVSALFLYLKKPKEDIATSKKSALSKLKEVMMLWSLGLFVAFIAGVCSSLFLSEAGVDDSQNLLNNFFSNYSIVFVIFVVFFWGPITEELTFRLGLRFSPFRFGFMLALLLFVFMEIIASLNDNFSGLVEKYLGILGSFNSFFVLILFFLLFGLLLGIIVKRTKLNNLIEQIYKSYYVYIFYGLATTFAAIHLFNFENFRDIWLALPFLVAPQLLLGLILSYVRMKYSINWSIFYHIIHNALASAPVLFISRISTDSLETLNKGGDLVKDVSNYEKIMFASGAGLGLLILTMFLLFFSMLVQEHHDYRKYKKFVQRVNS